MKQTERSSQSGVNRDSNEKGKGLVDDGGGVRTEVEGGHLAYLPRPRQPSQRAVVDAKRNFRPPSRPHPRL